MPARNASGRRTDKRIVPNFESPDFPLLELAIPAISDDVAEEVVEIPIVEEAGDSEAVLMMDVGIRVDDCRDVDAEVVDLDVELAVNVADEDDGVVTALLVLKTSVLLGLLDPPYVHPSPSGIEGP
jgi:hypothetical protein